MPLLPELAAGELVAGGTHRLGARAVCADRRHVDAAWVAPAHGERATGPHADAAARTAGLPGPELREANADLGRARPSPVWRSSRRFLPSALGPRATPAATPGWRTSIGI